MTRKRLRVYGWAIENSPEVELRAGWREPTDPYPRVWLHTWKKEVVEKHAVEGLHYVIIDLAFFPHQKALDAFVEFINNMVSQIEQTITNVELSGGVFNGIAEYRATDNVQPDEGGEPPESTGDKSRRRPKRKPPA